MEKVSMALSTVTATHQTVAILEVLGSVIDQMIATTFNNFSQPKLDAGFNFREGTKYLADLLQNTIAGIDINDTQKSASTIKFYYSKNPKITNLIFEFSLCFLFKFCCKGFLSCVPLIDSSNQSFANSDSMEIDNNENAKSVTAFFADWVPQLLDRLFLKKKKKNEFTSLDAFK